MDEDEKRGSPFSSRIQGRRDRRAVVVCWSNSAGWTLKNSEVNRKELWSQLSSSSRGTSLGIFEVSAHYQRFPFYDRCEELADLTRETARQDCGHDTGGNTADGSPSDPRGLFDVRIGS